MNLKRFVKLGLSAICLILISSGKQIDCCSGGTTKAPAKDSLTTQAPRATEKTTRAPTKDLPTTQAPIAEVTEKADNETVEEHRARKGNAYNSHRSKYHDFNFPFPFQMANICILYFPLMYFRERRSRDEGMSGGSRNV